MKFYESLVTERVGYDFYCDVANNIVKERKRKGLTQEQLADIAGVKASRIANMENVKIRFGIDDLTTIAKALDVDINYLIEAELDAGGQECLYHVWWENCEKMTLYQRATSKRMAALLFEKRLKDIKLRPERATTRIFAKLVGVPVTKEELTSEFRKSNGEDIYFDEDENKTN